MLVQQQTMMTFMHNAATLFSKTWCCTSLPGLTPISQTLVSLSNSVQSSPDVQTGKGALLNSSLLVPNSCCQTLLRSQQHHQLGVCLAIYGVVLAVRPGQSCVGWTWAAKNVMWPLPTGSSDVAFPCYNTWNGVGVTLMLLSCQLSVRPTCVAWMMHCSLIRL